MDDILTTERLLILLLAFCMGARFISANFNGHSFSLRGESKKPEHEIEQ